MTRNEKILAGLDLSKASSIEIGALDKPIVPPTSPLAFYVDHADTAGLREKYRSDPSVDVGSIVEVGGVWGDKTLAEAAAAVVPVDFVVGSHVIEHVPDLIGWLHELAAVLKDGGEVRLAVPDRRHTFDYLRRETELPEVLEAYVLRARTPSPRCIVDHVLNVRNVDCGRSWDETLVPESLTVKDNPVDAEARARDSIANGTYHDVHCWVFTPHSFARLMLQIAEAGHLPFECADLQDSERYTYEFLCSMRKSTDSAGRIFSWRRAVQTFQEKEEAAQRRMELAARDRVRALATEVATLRDVRHAAAKQLGQTQEQLAETRQQLSESLRQFAEARERLIAVERSRTWRWTAPLRDLARWGKRVDRRRRGKT